MWLFFLGGLSSLCKHKKIHSGIINNIYPMETYTPLHFPSIQLTSLSVCNICTHPHPVSIYSLCVIHQWDKTDIRLNASGFSHTDFFFFLTILVKLSLSLYISKIYICRILSVSPHRRLARLLYSCSCEGACVRAVHSDKVS